MTYLSPVMVVVVQNLVEVLAFLLHLVYNVSTYCFLNYAKSNCVGPNLLVHLLLRREPRDRHPAWGRDPLHCHFETLLLSRGIVQLTNIKLYAFAVDR